MFLKQKHQHAINQRMLKMWFQPPLGAPITTTHNHAAGILPCAPSALSQSAVFRRRRAHNSAHSLRLRGSLSCTNKRRCNTPFRSPLCSDGRWDRATCGCRRDHASTSPSFAAPPSLAGGPLRMIFLNSSSDTCRSPSVSLKASMPSTVASSAPGLMALIATLSSA